MKLRSPLKKSPTTLSLFYASDVHGSGVCWRKFVNAARFYGVGALVMGGDLCGKGLVPVVGSGSSWSATVSGEQRTARDAAELEEIERAIRHSGFYPWRTDAEGALRLAADSAFAGEVFDRVMLEELEGWVEFADDRLRDDPTEVFVMAGNDDPFEVDAVLAGGEKVVHCDEKIVMVGPHEMLSLGYANRTPWDTPRELDEEDLYARLSGLAAQLESPRTAIFNLHVPPYDSGLDTAIELDETFTPVLHGGQPHQIPVGSTAVRQVLEEVQPLVSLHGHIHEAGGSTRIGRTLAINAGSEYGEGILHGVLLTVGGGRIVRFQATRG